MKDLARIDCCGTCKHYRGNDQWGWCRNSNVLACGAGLTPNNAPCPGYKKGRRYSSLKSGNPHPSELTDSKEMRICEVGKVILSFGKFREHYLMDVPDWYLKWLITKNVQRTEYVKYCGLYPIVDICNAELRNRPRQKSLLRDLLASIDRCTGAGSEYGAVLQQEHDQAMTDSDFDFDRYGLSINETCGSK